MRYRWDRLRWRFVAVFYLAWWLLKGLPKHGMGGSRWGIAQDAWSACEETIMYRHETLGTIGVGEFLTRRRER